MEYNVEDFKLRMINEQAQLCEKIDKLEAFINEHHKADKNISNEYVALLIRQLYHMKKYSEMLQYRLEYDDTLI